MPAYTGTGGRSRLAPPFSGAISNGEGFAEPRLHRRADAYFPGTHTVAKSLGNRMAKLTICTNSRVRSGKTPGTPPPHCAPPPQRPTISTGMQVIAPSNSDEHFRKR